MPLGRAWPVIAAGLLLACAQSGGQRPSAHVTQTRSAAQPEPVTVVASADAGAVISEPGIGPSGPVIFLRASSIGAWVAVCHPREADVNAASSDAWQRTLLLPEGKTLAVSDVAAAEAGGRYLVVERNNRFELVDAVQGTQRSLSQEADSRRMLSNYAEHRSFAFDAAGTHLATLTRDSAGRVRVVIRDLRFGREVVGPPLQVQALRLAFVGTTPQALVLYGVTQDSNGDGRRTLPVALTDAAAPCRKPGAFDASTALAGDEVVPLLVNLKDGTTRQIPGFVARQGKADILRDSRQRLLREVGSGQSLLADEECGARVLAGNVARQNLLVACLKKPGRSPLRLVAPNANLELGVDLALAGDDLLERLDTQVFAVHPGRDAALVDLVNGRVRLLGDGHLVLSVHGRYALVRHASRLLGLSIPESDAALLAPKILIDRLPAVSDVVHGSEHISINGFIVERATGNVLGRIQEPVLAVDKRGRALVSATADGGDLTGPLRYEVPLRMPLK